MNTLQIGGADVTIGGDTIDFSGAPPGLRDYQFSSIVSASGNAPSQLLQFAAIISLDVIVPSKTLQFASIVSVTEPIVGSFAYQFANIISVSPGRPHIHYPINMLCRGPYNLYKDMPVSGRKN